MLTFRSYMENLWGEIPWAYAKPSDGIGGHNPNPSRPDQPGGGGMPMGAPPRMMRKGMKKRMRKA